MKAKYQLNDRVNVVADGEPHGLGTVVEYTTDLGHVDDVRVALDYGVIIIFAESELTKVGAK